MQSYFRASISEQRKLTGEFRGASSDFSPRTAKKNVNPFFPGACTSGKTLLGPQVCERERVRAAGCKAFSFHK